MILVKNLRKNYFPMHKIRLVHIIYAKVQGGLEHGVTNLVNNMNRTPFENNICCISEGKEFGAGLHNSVNVVRMHKRPGNDLSFYLRLTRLLRELKPTVVHTRNWAGIDGVICAKIARVPIIIHGEHGFETKDLTRQDSKRKLIRRFMLLTMVNGTITVSQNLKDRLISELGILPKKITYIPNGVDTYKFCVKKKEIIRQRFRFNQNNFIIGIVARLDPIKNHKNLICVFNELCNIYPDLKLLIVGDGALGDELKEQVNKLNISEKVFFMGNRNDVSEIYNLFDVFILPSLNEGMSNTILEAMASGLPVIASNVGGNPELVIDGKTGFLFPAKDQGYLYKSIETYILHPEIKMQHGYFGRQRVLKEFTLDQMVKSYENLYLNLIRSKLKMKKYY